VCVCVCINLCVCVFVCASVLVCGCSEVILFVRACVWYSMFSFGV
jgi:hypothetical protein